MTIRRWMFAWSWTVATVLLISCASAPSAPPLPVDPPHPVAAPLIIRVVDAGDQLPIEGARVALLGLNEVGATNRLGIATFRVPVRGYHAVVTADGYEKAEEPAGNEPGDQSPIPIELHALAATLQNLNIWVLDAAARPVAGGFCTVGGETRQTDSGGFLNFAVATPVTSECGGKGYQSRLVDLPPGEHRVHLERAPLPPIGTIGEPPWRGTLRLARDDLGYVDEDGSFVLPQCLHYMEAFSAFVHEKTVDGVTVEQQLRTAKAAGHQCIRFLDILGFYDENRPDQPVKWAAWKGKEVTPYRFVAYSGRTIEPTPNYYQQLEAFLRLCQSIGLTVQHDRGDMNALTFTQVRDHVHRIVPIYDRVGWGELAMMAACNECWQNGGFSAAQMAEMLAPYRARGAIVGHSDADQPEEPEALAEISKGAPIYIVHGLRVGPPSLLMDHIFSLGYFLPRQNVQRLGWQREPTGPGAGVSVGRVEDRETLALMAATAWLSRQAWNYMCGDCVFWNAPIERSAAFYAVPRMREVLQAFAPDVMTWPTLRHGGRVDAALNSPTGWFGDPGVIEGPGRINQAISADRRKVVGTVTGGSGRKQVRNALGCALNLTVVKVNDDESIQQDTFTLAPGQSLTLEYRVGRLLLGVCQ